MSAKTKLGKDVNTLKIKHISEVENGLNCNCNCVKCDNKLIAINGKTNKREIHFRHEVESICNGGIETALHLLAKQIIIENDRIRISYDSFFDYSKSELEVQLSDYNPDIIIEGGEPDKKWLIEIAVTSFIKSEKLEKIKRDNYNCLEIDLKDIERNITPDDLKEIVLNNNNVRNILNKTKDLKVEKENYSLYIWSLILVTSIWLFKPFKRKRKNR